jgi:hypothetical protein
VPQNEIKIGSILCHIKQHNILCLGVPEMFGWYFSLVKIVYNLVSPLTNVLALEKPGNPGYLLTGHIYFLE